jgi:uncharacterized protein (TIGR03435 family)
MKFAPLVCLALLALAQSVPKFEVATIKLAAPNAIRNRVVPAASDRLSIPSMNLTWLIYTAYGEGLGTTYRVTGVPESLDKTYYAIEAKAPQPMTQRQLRMMLRSLLEERFALKIHTEVATGGNDNVYGLFLDRSDGKLGPNVQEWDGTCNSRPPANNDSDDPFTPRCPSGYTPRGLMLEGVTMYSVADALSLPQSRSLLGTIVQDHTGLNGRYKMLLDFQFTPPRPVDPAAPPDFAPQTLFQAVREQWGLKLERTKGALNLLVVESAQPPIGN